MRLTTIWTLSAMTLAERVRRTADLAAQVAAARLVPARVRYWVFIQQGAKHIRGDEVVPDVRFTDLLARVDGGPK